MSRDLDLVQWNNEWIFNSPDYVLSYRYAICYSLAKKILNSQSNNNQEWAIKQIEDLINAIEEKIVYHEPGFIKLFPLSNEMGFVLVDQTDSYYPLVFSKEGKQRVPALQHSLKDIKDGMDEIFSLISNLERISEWSDDFQDRLFCVFPSRAAKNSILCQAA